MANKIHRVEYKGWNTIIGVSCLCGNGAAMAKFYAVLNCKKTGAGEGVRTLDFHLGNPIPILLPEIDSYISSLTNNELIPLLCSFTYNRNYRISTGVAATVRQWKICFKNYDMTEGHYA